MDGLITELCLVLRGSFEDEVVVDEELHGVVEYLSAFASAFANGASNAGSKSGTSVRCVTDMVLSLIHI